MSCHGAGITWPGAEQQTDSSLRDLAARVRFRHERGETESRARHLGVESARVANRHAPRHPPPRGGETEGRAASRGGHAGHWLRGRQPLSASRSPSERQPCLPIVRYESIRRGTLRILRRYCSDRTELAQRSLKFDPYPAKLRAMQRAAP